MYKGSKKDKWTWIYNRVAEIRETTGLNYVADYVGIYGGWELCIVGDKGQHSYGYLGEAQRKSTDEMIAYLEGITRTFHYFKMTR